MSPPSSIFSSLPSSSSSAWPNPIFFPRSLLHFQSLRHPLLRLHWLRAVPTMAEETKNPTSDIPVGLVGSMTLTTLLYCLLVVTLCLMQPFHLGLFHCHRYLGELEGVVGVDNDVCEDELCTRVIESVGDGVLLSHDVDNGVEGESAAGDELVIGPIEWIPSKLLFCLGGGVECDSLKDAKDGSN
ncbi:hypothetical protein FEM48_Zijuj05G0165200 [Ziziphus jujuba var. spinosa]|uniref:Uncharacterized protein n=1 Tax=Ziziphus jujuba var. spinosa TaxID=714518 RepID=A0A978VFW7_ZIZJJ|nr:hypothetical protein FEM48_Zijuj05G0165200 [Ziziphus jujuba var. spinosa]